MALSCYCGKSDSGINTKYPVSVNASASVNNNYSTTQAQITITVSAKFTINTWTQSSGLMCQIICNGITKPTSTTYSGLIGNGNGTIKYSYPNEYTVVHTFEVNKTSSSRSIGWSVNIHASYDMADRGAQGTISDNTIIAALPTYTVTYHTNGGTGSMDNSTVTYNQPFTTPQNAFRKEGYIFTGWNESADGTGTDWTDWIGKPWTWTYTSDITLYAQWKANDYKLTFTPNGGMLPNPGINLNNPDGNNSNYVTVTYDSPNYCLMTGDIPTYKGHTFLGWYAYDSPAAGEYVYDSTGKAIECTYWRPDNNNSSYIWKYPNNLEVSAQWEPNQYTITFNGNGGDVIANSLSLLYGTNQNANLSEYIPSRTGYKFLGWYSFASDGVQIYDESGNCTNEGTYWRNNTYIYDGDLILYAHWKQLNIAHYKLNGKWILCNSYIKVNGVWKPAIFYKNTGGNYIFEISVLTDENATTLTDENGNTLITIN